MTDPRPGEGGFGIPESGFAGLVDFYGGQVLAFALNILGNREDAEDAVQETFVRVFRNLASYDPGRSVKTWIFTIAYRHCLDIMKKKRRFAAAFARARYELPVSSNPGPARNLPAEILGTLSARQRTALSLWACEGWTAREIARILDCSESTARVTLFNARKKLKSLLESRDASLQNG